MSVCRPQLPGTPKRVRVSASLALLRAPHLSSRPASQVGGGRGAGVRCVSVGLSGHLHAGGVCPLGTLPCFQSGTGASPGEAAARCLETRAWTLEVGRQRPSWGAGLSHGPGGGTEALLGQAEPAPHLVTSAAKGAGLSGGRPGSPWGSERALATPSRDQPPRSPQLPVAHRSRKGTALVCCGTGVFPSTGLGWWELRPQTPPPAPPSRSAAALVPPLMCQPYSKRTVIPGDSDSPQEAQPRARPGSRLQLCGGSLLPLALQPAFPFPASSPSSGSELAAPHLPGTKPSILQTQLILQESPERPLSQPPQGAWRRWGRGPCTGCQRDAPAPSSRAGSPGTQAPAGLNARTRRRQRHKPPRPTSP